MTLTANTRRHGVRMLAMAVCLVVASIGSATFAADAVEWTREARRIVDQGGIQGGLIVHIGCGEGRLTAALRVNDRFLVHGLDRDTQNVAKARTFLRSIGLNGSVSVDGLRGEKLPYTDNLANLVVISGEWQVANKAKRRKRRKPARTRGWNEVPCTAISSIQYPASSIPTIGPPTAMMRDAAEPHRRECLPAFKSPGQPRWAKGSVHR